MRSVGCVRWLPAALFAVVLSSGCASGRFVPPVGLATPLPSSTETWADATRACAETTSLAGELRASGRIGGQRIPTIVIGTVLDAAGHIAMEARYGGASVFVLRGTADSAALLLNERREIATGPAEAILDALVGVPLGPARLLAILAGCVTVSRAATSAEAIDRFARVATTDATVYLARVGERWRVRAGRFDRFTVDYREFGAALPRRISIRSDEDRQPAVDLTIEIAAFDTAPRSAELFTPVVPAGTTPISIETLREAGPLGR